MGEYVNALRTTPLAFELPSLEFVLTNLFVELENDPLKDIFNQERTGNRYQSGANTLIGCIFQDAVLVKVSQHKSVFMLFYSTGNR